MIYKNFKKIYKMQTLVTKRLLLAISKSTQKILNFKAIDRALKGRKNFFGTIRNGARN